MNYLCLPVGNRHGWGVCGTYLTRGLAALGPVKLFAGDIGPELVPDELERLFLQSRAADRAEAARAQGPQPYRVPYPVFQSITGDELLPGSTGSGRDPAGGLYLLRTNAPSPRAIENAHRYFDIVTAGSTWCEQVLRDHGLTATGTLIQGVDGQIFNPECAEKAYGGDRFVVFSGGKFELRKGQDLVLRAFKALQDRHPDVLLVTSWFNFWGSSMATMSASPYIRFQPSQSDYRVMMWRVVSDAGIDPRRVLTLPPQPNAAMARIYKNTDVGLFPNRCEGGTNLVLMEYMACGKCAIAAFNTGHRDVLTAGNSIRILGHKPMTICRDGEPVAVWDDPDLEETVERLEWAYQHRDEAAGIGRRAGDDMRRFSWAASARRAWELLRP